MDLAVPVHAATGHDLAFCRLLIAQISRALRRAYLNNEPIIIEGFGSLVPRNGRLHFHPDKGMLTKMDAPRALPAPPTASLAASTKHPTPEAIGMLLPIRAIPPDDLDLVNRWCAARQGDPNAPATVTEHTLYSRSANRRQRLWADASVTTARTAVEAFLRRSSSSVRTLGIVDGVVHTNLGRREIVAYAQDYYNRAIPRLNEIARRAAATGQPPLTRGQDPWRTTGWNRFVHMAGDFFDFLEDEGIRPRNSNPLTGIRLDPISQFLRGRILVVPSRFERVLAHPLLSPRERVVCWLLASGMRAGEIGRVQRTDISPDCSQIKINGKGGRLRILYLDLFPEAIAAVRFWLFLHATRTSTLAFSGRQGTPLIRDIVAQIVQRSAMKAFPGREQIDLRRSLHPHAFRHYYVTTARQLGLPLDVIMRQVGHSSLAMLDRYTSFDEPWVRDQVQHVASRRTPLYPVPGIALTTIDRETTS